MMKLDISFETQKGSRPYQEDRFYVGYLEDGYLLAVMDGHGGDHTATLLRENLEKVWFAFSGVAAVERIKLTFANLHQLTKDERSGSTLSLAWIPDSEDRVYVGVLGDSPVIVKSYDGTVYFSAEHNVRSNAAEAKAVEEKGGMVSDGYAFLHFNGLGLQMSRALGDVELAPILNREPEITEYPLGKGSFVLVGSDGCFDPGHGSDDAAQQVVAMVEQGGNATEVVARAIKAKVYDNATAVLVRVEDVE